MNTSLSASLAEIAQSRKGKKVAAFIDLDGTLIAGYSGRYLASAQRGDGSFGLDEVVKGLSLFVSNGVNNDMYGGLMEIVAGAWKGKSQAELDDMGERMFTDSIEGIIYPEMRDIVEAHHKRGHVVVLSSSATSFQAEAIARHLDIDHVICNRFEVGDDGLLTGNVVPPVVFGPSKAAAAAAFAEERGIDLSASYFYADGDEDEPLMRLVGKPRPTNPKAKLKAVAQEEDWPIQSFESRGGGLKRLAKMAAGIYAGVPLIGMSAAVGVLRRDKRATVNFLFDNWVHTMFKLSGVEVNVVGRKNLWAHRPCVFIVNHRTSFDGLVILSLVQRDYTVLSKMKTGNNPLTHAIGDFMDIVWVDHGTHEERMEQLREVEKLTKKGLSLLVAPEGTRHQGRGIGEFKKGAFRFAMSAGVPIVPIVVRNADVIGGHSALTLHPGTVDVAVLDAVDVTDWTLDNLDEQIEAVRASMQRTLDDWPHEPEGTSA